MQFKSEYFFCSHRLLQNVDEIQEIYKCIENVKWSEDFTIEINNHTYKHQRAYNKALELEFTKYNWELQPLLYHDPKLIGDFRKI